MPTVLDKSTKSSQPNEKCRLYPCHRLFAYAKYTLWGVVCGVVLTQSAWAQINFGSPAKFVGKRVSDVGTDGNGIWVAVWSATETGMPSSYVLASRSLDNGTTWTAPMILNPEKSAYPALSTDGLGRWITIWRQSTIVTSATIRNRTYEIARSTDNGAIWSAAEDFITSSPLTANVKIASDGNDTWVVTWEAKEGIYWTRSVDHGQTWSAPAALVLDSSPRSYRPELANDGQGHWIIVWESVDTAGIKYARSADNGLTWSGPHNLYPSNPTLYYRYPTVAMDKAGHAMIAHETADKEFFDMWMYRHYEVSVSSDFGQTWSAPITVKNKA